MASGTPPGATATPPGPVGLGAQPWRDWYDELACIPTGPPVEEGSHNIDQTVRFPCSLTYNGGTCFSRVIAGISRAEYTPTGRVAFPDAYHAGGAGECAYGHAIGTACVYPAFMEVRVAPVFHMDTSTTDGGMSKHLLQVHEYTGVGCTGTLLRTMSDLDSQCTSTVAATSWNYDFDTGDHSGCHEPHVLFNGPSTAGTYYYKVEMTTRACDADGVTNCTAASDTGCFTVTVI
ncbi:MAG TPA: hypothetical protein VG389_08800 [Myxococcota bacterium]|nr:hypothetical protein [Myxococcota bacterium]